MPQRVVPIRFHQLLIRPLLLKRSILLVRRYHRLAKVAKEFCCLDTLQQLVLLDRRHLVACSLDELCKTISCLLIVFTTPSISKFSPQLFLAFVL